MSNRFFVYTYRVEAAGGDQPTNTGGTGHLDLKDDTVPKPKRP